MIDRHIQGRRQLDHDIDARRPGTRLGAVHGVPADASQLGKHLLGQSALLSKLADAAADLASTV